MKNGKCGGADADGVDLESGSDCGQLISFLDKCQMDMFVTSVKNAISQVKILLKNLPFSDEIKPGCDLFIYS